MLTLRFCYMQVVSDWSSAVLIAPNVGADNSRIPYANREA